jgi:hypothetical protein
MPNRHVRFGLISESSRDLGRCEKIESVSMMMIRQDLIHFLPLRGRSTRMKSKSDRVSTENARVQLQ